MNEIGNYNGSSIMMNNLNPVEYIRVKGCRTVDSTYKRHFLVLFH